MGGDLASVPITVESDTTNFMGARTVIGNYILHPHLCRSGIWFGWETWFSETMKLGWEHDEVTPRVAVQWIINQTLVQPTDGSDRSIPPGPQPCPGAPSVMYTNPVDDLYHRISLTSAAGSEPVSIAVQVSWQSWDETGTVTHLDGTSQPYYVSLKGSEIIWPKNLLKEEEGCLLALWGRLGKLALLAHVNPGDPVQFLRGLPQEQQVELQGAAEVLRNIDPEEQPQLANALQATVVNILRQGMGRALGVRFAARQPAEAPPRDTI